MDAIVCKLCVVYVRLCDKSCSFENDVQVMIFRNGEGWNPLPRVDYCWPFVAIDQRII